MRISDWSSDVCSSDLELRDRRFENQTYRASGLNLLVAAIILWNTRYLEMALADIGTPDEIARHIAPLGWEHISLTGDYSWNVEDRPDPDALRPLRAVSSRSEEHTSELQSLMRNSYAVFCLKKKIHKKNVSSHSSQS